MSVAGHCPILQNHIGLFRFVAGLCYIDIYLIYLSLHLKKKSTLQGLAKELRVQCR